MDLYSTVTCSCFFVVKLKLYYQRSSVYDFILNY